MFMFVLTDDANQLLAEAVRGMTLGFELPNNFLHPERYRNQDLDYVFSIVPDVVSTALFEVMPSDVPIDPQMPFVYLRQNLLPEFVVAWFMAYIPSKRIGKTTRFFRALNAVEQYREFIFFPPNAADARDTIVAGGGALPEHLLPGGEERQGTEQGVGEGEPQASQQGVAEVEPQASVEGVARGEKLSSEDDPLNVGFVDDSDED